jgi:hypothetical protein
MGLPGGRSYFTLFVTREGTEEVEKTHKRRNGDPETNGEEGLICKCEIELVTGKPGVATAPSAVGQRALASSSFVSLTPLLRCVSSP